MSKNIFHHTRFSDFTLMSLRNQFPDCMFNFQFRFRIIEKGQVPITALIVLNGQITLMNDKKDEIALEKGSIFGIHEIKKNLPSAYNCIIEKNTQVLVMEKKNINLMEAPQF